MEFFRSVETHGDGWSGGGSFDLVHWPPRYAVGVLPPDGPIVHVRDGVTSPAHGRSVLQSLRFRRAEAFSGDTNAATHWQHIDDVIALLGGGAPYAQSWDTHRIEHLRIELERAMTNVTVESGAPWARSPV